VRLTFLLRIGGGGGPISNCLVISDGQGHFGSLRAFTAWKAESAQSFQVGFFYDFRDNYRYDKKLALPACVCYYMVV